MGDPSTTLVATTTVAGSSTSTSIDSNHPYHLHPSDSPGMTLINAHFDGKGYQGWKRSVFIALSAKNKLGFISGSTTAPSSDSPDLQVWSRCNDMVTSWLLNSLSKEIADSVIYSKTARDLWISLEQRFGQSNGAKLFHLQQELNRLTQGNNNIAGYFTQLKRLWDELDSLNSNIKCGCVCVCEGKQKLEKSLQDERLIKFLMGLNDTYSQARGNILMINPLPNINLAYSLILQDEHQRESYMNPPIPSDSSAFMAGTGGFMTGNRNQYRGGKQVQRTNDANQKSGNQFPRSAQPQQSQRFQIQKLKGRRMKYNPNVSCDYCGKQGHEEINYYRLIGYPDDFQFTNHKGSQGQIRGNAAVSMEDFEGKHNNCSGNAALNQGYSKEQYNQFIHMFKQMKMEESADTSGGHAINANAVAGPFNEEASSFW